MSVEKTHLRIRKSRQDLLAREIVGSWVDARGRRRRRLRVWSFEGNSGAGIIGVGTASEGILTLKGWWYE